MVVDTGRVAVLQLRGDLGELDVWCVYLHASEPKTRMETIRTISKNMSTKERCLSILAGDWNFTTHAHDRYSKTHSTWTGDSQNEEAYSFLTTLVNGKGCQEIFQPLHTHEDGLVRSRIDRVYINQHQSDFLDKDVNSWVGSFPLDLSHHRPLHFHRKTRPPKINCESHSIPIPARALRHSTFRPKLEQLWASWSDQLQHCTPLEQLAELKRAIRITANSILRVAKDIPPVLTEDRLNDVMKCIRWWEAGKHANIHTLLQKTTRNFLRSSLNIKATCCSKH